MIVGWTQLGPDRSGLNNIRVRLFKLVKTAFCAVACIS